MRSVVASHRRETAASLPPHTHAAKAAVAACFALASGAILGITAIVNDGLVAPLPNNPSPVLSQGAGPDGATAGGPVAGTQPNPMAFPAPAATQSMVASRQASQPLLTPAAHAPSRHLTADDPSGSSAGRDVDSSVAVPDARSVAPRRADTLQPDRPIAPIQLANKPVASGTAGGDEDKRGRGAIAGFNQPSSPQSSPFSQKSASTHGLISADGTVAHAESTAGRESTLNQGSPRR